MPRQICLWGLFADVLLIKNTSFCSIIIKHYHNTGRGISRCSFLSASLCSYTLCMLVSSGISILPPYQLHLMQLADPLLFSSALLTIGSSTCSLTSSSITSTGYRSFPCFILNGEAVLQNPDIILRSSFMIIPRSSNSFLFCRTVGIPRPSVDAISSFDALLRWRSK